MCTYSELKKIKLCVTPQGVNDAPYVPKLYASSRIDISKCIEGGSMKLTKLVDCFSNNKSLFPTSTRSVQSRMHFRVIYVIFF